MIYQEKFIKVYPELERSIRKHPSISAHFRTLLLAVLINSNTSVPIVSGKFKLNTAFLRLFINLAFKQIQAKSDAELIKHEKAFYKEFKRLKKFGLVHKNSITFYPRSLSLISINPNHISLLSKSFHKINTLDTAIKSFEKHCNKGTNSSEYQLYLYLRLFHIIPFSSAQLQKITWGDIIKTTNGKHLLIIYHEGFLYNASKPYKIILLDQQASKLIQRLKNSQEIDNLLFTNVVRLEENMKKNRMNSSIKDLSISEIRQLNKIRYMYQTSPLNLTVRTGVVTSVPISLAEIESLLPGSVRPELMIEERKRIESSTARLQQVDENDEESWQFITFDIYDMDDLIKLLRHPDNIPPKGFVQDAMFELRQAFKVSKSNHLKMISQYLLYLINLLDNNKIRLSTLKGYVWLLNKHLFRMIEDFENIKQHEVMRISERLDSFEYKKNSASKIRSQINRFFRYFKKNDIVIDIAGAFYPKSIVFEFEIDAIIYEIEEDYKKRMGFKKIGKHHRHYIDQMQVLVLLGFYCGVRLNEARTLQLRDIYFYGNELHLDINSKGIKKAGLRLKTVNAKRRIDVVIEKKEHMEKIKKWMSVRDKLEKRSKFAFLELSKHNGFVNSVLEEDVFQHINSVIKLITKRYCSYHSLRHSFVTYQCRQYFLSGDTYPYSFMELSQMAGHQTPDITIQSYLHGNILFILGELTCE